MALQPAAVAQKERKWMVDKRTKRAVRVNVTQQPATVSTIDRESFRDILFDSSMVYSQERVDHSIDYVTSRAPLIGGKLYSGIEMQRRAKPTMRTQPVLSKSAVKKKKRQRQRHRQNHQARDDEHDYLGDNDDTPEASALAKALAIKLPTHLSAPLPANPLNPLAVSSSTILAPDPIISSLARHQGRIKRAQNRRMNKIKDARKELSSSVGYGVAKSRENLLVMPPLITQQAAAAQPPAPYKAVLPLEKASQPFLQREPTEKERIEMEQKLIKSAYSLLDHRLSNDKQLRYYNKLNNSAINSLPLNYVFRKAVDKYIRTKTSSAVERWKKYVKIHRAHETEQGFKSLQCSIIQRAIRCYLARSILKIQRRKREAHKLDRLIFLQNCWRRKIAFDVWHKKKADIRSAHENFMCAKIQSNFRVFVYGSVPARKIMKVELHKALKCLTGRMSIHRAPVLAGLLPSESKKLSRCLEIVTHPGTPYRTMGTPSEIRFLISSCWGIITRREEEGARQKDRWKESKKRKEEERRKKLEEELKSHKAAHQRRLDEQRAIEEYKKMTLEESEAQRRIQRRLEKEIDALAAQEQRGSKNECEAMNREERFQKQRVSELEARRKNDIMLEVSMFQAEDRYARDLRQRERDSAEEAARRDAESEHMKAIAGKGNDMTKKINRVRFHRKKNRYFKSPKNRREYLSKKQRDERKKKGGQVSEEEGVNSLIASVATTKQQSAIFKQSYNNM